MAPHAPRGFRQARCSGCGLTAETCLCAAFPPLACSVAISVVMSRSEARSASNSARLLSLWLPSVDIHVRGIAPSGDTDGAPDALDPRALLARPGSALLFPGSGTPLPLPGGVRHLIIPDGTWSQARRIERRWFAAEALPRVELGGAWPSVYALRRERGSRCSGLCTFEAAAVALGLLEDVALAGVLLERFTEWARRARALKAGRTGAEVLAEAHARPAPPHPAQCLLRELPPQR